MTVEEALAHALASSLGHRFKPTNEKDRQAVAILIELRVSLGIKIEPWLTAAAEAPKQQGYPKSS